MSRVLALAVLSFLLFSNFTCSVNAPEPDPHVKLPIIYHPQECPNYCGIACIQMWAHWDGDLVSQQEIADYVAFSGSGTNPVELEKGVGNYTCSPGWIAALPWDFPGAQGDLIAAAIRGIDAWVPAIMPYWADHAILVFGFKWKVDANGKPLAILVHYHDPNGAPDQKRTAQELAYFFQPALYNYWVVLGYEDFYSDGVAGHESFILNGGTYYGGPNPYDPKGLTQDPHPF